MSGYPEFSREQMEWFVGLLEAVIPQHPEDVDNVARHKDGLDLELEIYIKPRSRGAFTAKVCIDLEQQVAKRTGVMKPVVYLHDHPHPEAAEALNYAARRL